jgi:hypothetical protein
MNPERREQEASTEKEKSKLGLGKITTPTVNPKQEAMPWRFSQAQNQVRQQETQKNKMVKNSQHQRDQKE